MGDVYDAARNKEVWDERDASVTRWLEAGESVIADATNLPVQHRAELRALAAAQNAPIHAIVFRNISQAVSRNDPRRGKAHGSQRVPDSAMIDFVILYERMLIDIETEAYDSVTYVERTV